MMKDQYVLRGMDRVTDANSVQGQVTGVAGKWGFMDVVTNFNIAKQFIGSYRFDSFVGSNGNYMYNVVSDSKSVRSLFYHIIPERYNKDRKVYTNHFGNTYQFYIWRHHYETKFYIHIDCGCFVCLRFHKNKIY